VEEMLLIFCGMLTKSGLVLEQTASAPLKKVLEQLKQEAGDRFANGRSVRMLFEEVLANQANRLMAVNGEGLSAEDISLIEAVDISSDVSRLIDLNP
jgi:hypothetical protein